MTQKTGYSEKKPEKQKKWKKTVLCCFSVLFFVYAGLDFYGEVFGLPEWAVRRMEHCFLKAGVQVHADSVRIGIVKGIRIANLKGTDTVSGICFSTPELTGDWKPLRFFTGVLLPFKMEFRKGTAWIPLLPEAGEEGKTDGLSLYDVSAVLSGERGQVRVQDVSARISSPTGFHISAQGTIDQLLHSILFRTIRDFNERISHKKSSEETDPPGSIVTFFPLSFRQKLLHLFRFLEQQHAAPEGNIRFHLDITDFLNCTGKAKLHVPKLQYGALTIQEISETVTLQHGIFRLEEMQLDLGNGASFLANGIYEDSGRTVKGTIDGKCRMNDLLSLLSPELRREAESQIQFGNGLVALHGTVESFSFSSRQANAVFSFALPYCTLKGVPLKNLDIQLSFLDGKTGILLKSAELCRGGTLSGECTLSGDSCTGNLSGSAHPEDFQKLLPADASEFLRKNAVFPENGISFSGNFSSPDLRKTGLSGDFHIQLKEIFLKGQRIHGIQTNLNFSPETIRLSGMDARMENGTRFTGELTCDLPRNQVFGRLICSGIPDRMIPAFDAICGSPYLAELTRDIRWPKSGDEIVADIEIFADFSEKPFYSLAGTLVMRDFSYCGVPFRYGAARFLSDSSGNILLPSVVLETGDGTVGIRAFSENLCKKTLDFSLKSTISGNDLLRLLVSDWEGNIIDFPFSVSLESAGLINYENDDNSRIRSKILNGTCLWAGIKMSDLDVQIEYQKQILSFQNAQGTIAGGRCHVDYHYDFTTGKGNTILRIDNAELAQLLQELPFLGLSSNSEDGRFSMTGNINFEYKGEDLLLFGKGQMILSGKELWNIPVLGIFLRYAGSIWPMVDSSAVTKIICDCEFQGDVCRITRIRSDGGIVSLSGDGIFRWNTGEYDCTFRAELLKNALPFDAVSTILTPVTWFLSKNLKGKLESSAKEKK